MTAPTDALVALADEIRAEHDKDGLVTGARLRHWERKLRALAAYAPEQAVDPDLVGWWNGMRPDKLDRDPYQWAPSIRWGADAEDDKHDIPLYAGFNPIHTHSTTHRPADAADRQTAGYDRALIAEMLADNNGGRFTLEAIAEQIRLLTEADNADAANVRTTRLPAGDARVNAESSTESVQDSFAPQRFEGAATAGTTQPVAATSGTCTDSSFYKPEHGGTPAELAAHAQQHGGDAVPKRFVFVGWASRKSIQRLRDDLDLTGIVVHVPMYAALTANQETR